MKRRYIIVLTLIVGVLFSVSVLQAQEPRAPSNDNSGSATYIALNGKYRTDDIHLASTEIGEDNCEFYNSGGSKSVWYIFQAPFSGTISITTAGSKLITNEFSTVTSTALTLYANDPLNQLDCSFSLGGTPSQLANVSITQGTYYFIRVTSLVAVLPGSFYVLRTSIDRASGFLSLSTSNKSFESGLDPWVAKNANNGDGVVCGTGDAYLGSCAFKFVGGANEATSLKGTFAWPVSTYFGLRDQIVLAQGQIKRVGIPVNASITLKVSYTDGTPTTKSKLPVTTVGGYNQFNVQLELASRYTNTVSLQIKNKSTGGTMFVDVLDIVYLPGAVRDARSGVLPLPNAIQ